MRCVSPSTTSGEGRDGIALAIQVAVVRLELRSPHIDSAPIGSVRAAFVPRVGEILELELDDLGLQGFEEHERAFLAEYGTWAWRVIAVRYPIRISPADRARRVILHLEPLVFGPER